jgi:hypothetical protein
MPKQERWTVLKSLLILEWIALLIGLAMPITPSKTGGDFSFADWFFEDPTYLQEVLVYFVMTNLLMGVLALVVLLMIQWDKRRKRSDG